MHIRRSISCLAGLTLWATAAWGQEAIISFDDVTGVTEALPIAPEQGLACATDSRDICGPSLTFDGGAIGGTVTVDANSQADGAGADAFVWYDLVTVKQGGIGASAQNGGPTSGDDNAVGGSDWIEVEFPVAVALTRFWMVGEHQGLPNSNVNFHVGGVGGIPYSASCSATQGDGLNSQDGSGNLCTFTENPEDVTATRFAFSAASSVNFYLAGVAFAPADCPVDPVAGVCTLVTQIVVPASSLQQQGVIKQFAPQVVLDPPIEPARRAMR